MKQGDSVGTELWCDVISAGAVGLVFSAFGILISGVFISKAKPSARFLAGWNVLVGVISAVGIVSYAFIGCPVNDRQGVLLASGQLVSLQFM